MRARDLKWVMPGLVVLAGAWVMWRWAGNRPAENAAVPGRFSFTAARPSLPGQQPAAGLPAKAKAALAANRFALRLSNTPQSIGELDPHAILLENALIDTRRPLDFTIPKRLQAREDGGSYIVQARGPVDGAFRAVLVRAGATEDTFKNYVPNNAYLARLTPAAAESLKASPLVQSVIAYEPYYKIQSSLLGAAVGGRPLPEGAVLTLGLFADGAAETMGRIEALGGVILSREQSPFGPMVRVSPPRDWTALAVLPGVQLVEAYHARVHANDVSRVNTGVSVNTTNSATYLGLSGSNVLVAVPDSGVDATHPGFSTGGTLGTPGVAPVRVLGQTAGDLTDTNGHGTFVAGEINGNGDMSTSPVKVGEVLAGMNYGSVTNADFRGKAPLAKVFSMNLNQSDQALQAAAALTNALISNNSWNHDGDNAYDLDAASYDAATRDSVPWLTGSQPVLYVFSAGNAGNGDDSSDPGGGDRDSIQSPATAKNVITVGAMQENRGITNEVTAADGTTNELWLADTSTGYRVAWFSSRGNVGVGIEGSSGRFKPDVVAPGTFIVSTRSQQWDTADYFYQSPTNTIVESFPGVVADPDSLWVNGFPLVPTNAIGVNITVSANANSPSPFPTLPMYIGLYGAPFPGAVITPQAISNQVNIPSDGGYAMADIFNNEGFYGFNYGISNVNSSPMSFDLTTTIILTNGLDNHLQVLSNLDGTLGPYYRFESGTSMAAADVSGVLALMRDFFVNHSTLTNPSPVLLKALLIAGARAAGSAYNFHQPDNRNYEGWGLVNLPNSLPATIQTNFSGGAKASSIFLQDQSPTNALATGDRHTFHLTLQTNNTVTLRVTLAWTDPPGNPAAAIKLVNSLELVVTNLDDPTNPVVYYGNDIPAGGFFNTPEPATNAVSVDAVNNVQNILIPPLLGTNYSVTVIGRAVNVNAVSAQTNSVNNASPSGIFAPNIAQDYALVITAGDGGAPGLFTVTDNGIVSNPTGGQDITFITQTNAPLMNQMVGAASPLLGTNTLGLGANTPWSSNGVVTLGMTNQWHFYVVTNTGPANDYTNAAFVTFSPETLSIPRMGVLAGSQVDATRPEADIDVYVTTDPTLTNLNPVAISNCLAGGRIGFSSPPGVTFNGASLGRGGVEYVVDNGGSKPGQVYYIGVKSEDQMASEYDFIPLFSNIPFSSLDANGNETVNGLPVPVNVPDGTPAAPGVNFVFGIAIFPITVGDLTVTITNTHQNFGDLYGTLEHSGGAAASTVDVLNNHDGWGLVASQAFIYNENQPASSNLLANIRYQGPSDGPGSLRNFFGKDGSGVWQLTEMDDALTQTGRVERFTMFIKKHQPLGHGSGVTNTVSAQQWVYDFVDVPPGATNLTISVTNLNGVLNSLTILPLEAYVKLGALPTTNNFDKMMVVPTTPTTPPPGSSLSIGPTDVPPLQPGRYWIGVWNTNAIGTPDQTYSLFATILPESPNTPEIDWASTNTSVFLDDAVAYSGIYVTNNQPIVSLNVGIETRDPRISDLVFHLISPGGTRVLLMENRGAASTNGAGVTVLVTNIITTTNAIFTTNGFDGLAAQDYPAGSSFANGWVVTSNQVSIVTDPTNAWQGSNYLALANGSISTNLTTVPGLFYTISFPYRGPGIAGWWRAESNAVDSIYGNNGILSLTSTDTIVWTNGFEGGGLGNYRANAGTYFAGGWFVEGTNGCYVNVITNGTSTLSPNEKAYQGTNCINLVGGNGCGISTNIATVPGLAYTLDFAYAKNPDTAAGQVGVVVDGNTLGVTSASQPDAWSSLKWRTATYAFTATSASTHLAFVYTNNVGLSNVLLDAIGLTTNLTETVTYTTNGEVATAFYYDGASNRLVVPDAPVLNFGPGADFSIDGWISPLMPPPDPTTGVMTFVDKRYSPNSTICQGYEFGLINGAMFLHLSDNIATSGQAWLSAGPDLRDGRMHHVAVSVKRNSTTGGNMYVDGARVLQFNPTTVPGDLTPSPAQPLLIGNHPEFDYDSFFKGRIDETSIYRRALSASEIKAIYAGGTNGKFDPVVFNSSPARSLAEAQISFTGQSPVTILGNNTNWQTYTTAFKAVSAQTTLTLAGVEPGMLLGPMVVTLQTTNVVTNNLCLTFTENTNLTTTPVKYLRTPFVPGTNAVGLSTNGFEGLTAADYITNSSFANGWIVTSNQVSVVTDAVNAGTGSNFLALASGSIFTNLPTVAGNSYTLTFAYRGPGIADWWRGENNANDSISGNNGIIVNGASYTNGEVGGNFSLSGASQYVGIPETPSLDSFGNQMTIDFWMYADPANAMNSFQGLVTSDYYGIEISFGFGFGANGLNWYINTQNGAYLISDVNGGGIPVSAGAWHYIAGSYDGSQMQLYVDGLPSGNPEPASGNILPMVSGDFLAIGSDDGRANYCPCTGRYFWGLLDEASIYRRALSSSEIKAIYAAGTNGKFDPAVFNSAPAQSLAEAQVSLNGQLQDTLYGNNTNWQVETITFTATQNGTTLSIAGLEPGMLVDDFTLTQAPGNLYTQPEQSLDAFSGENAQGLWQLEIQDDRAGAGLTNLLVSWQLQFVLGNTTAIPGVLSGGIGQTNQFIPAGDIAWYQINVTNANYATNRLLFASAPVNVWFDTNTPPATNIFFFNGTSYSKLLSTTNASPTLPSPNIYQGQTYYLGVQNPNSSTVNYGVEVDFDHGNASGSGLPLVIGRVTASGNATTFSWTASPTAQFEVEWTDDLSQPWQTDTNVITSGDGNFTFTDDGSQTAPAGPKRFYRLVQISP